MKMISAADAVQLTKEGTIKKENENLEMIFNSIAAMASEGEFTINLYRHLVPQRDRDLLETLDYKVISCNESFITISWRPDGESNGQ